MGNDKHKDWNDLMCNIVPGTYFVSYISSCLGILSDDNILVVSFSNDTLIVCNLRLILLIIKPGILSMQNYFIVFRNFGLIKLGLIRIKRGACYQNAI